MPPQLDIRSPAGERLWRSVQTFVVTFALTWAVTVFLAHVTLPQAPRARRLARMAIVVALPLASLMAARRFAMLYHRLVCRDGMLSLESSLRKVEVACHDVQGIIGAGGPSFDGEMVVWKSLVLIVEGRPHAIFFNQETNASTYGVLRQHCEHAWGVPFTGTLEPPVAGPELSPDDYVDALRHVRAYYVRHTQQALVTGLLMILGGAAIGGWLVVNVIGAGRRGARAIIWALLVFFIGLMMVSRAIRQIPVCRRIRHVEERLSEG